MSSNKNTKRGVGDIAQRNSTCLVCLKPQVPSPVREVGEKKPQPGCFLFRSSHSYSFFVEHEDRHPTPHDPQGHGFLGKSVNLRICLISEAEGYSVGETWAFFGANLFRCFCIIYFPGRNPVVRSSMSLLHAGQVTLLCGAPGLD